MTKTNKYGKNSPFSLENNIQASEDEKKQLIADVCRNNMIFREKSLQKAQTSSELIERIDWFFDTCASTGQFPTVEKMCLTIGYSRKLVWDWVTGRSQCKLIRQDTPQTVRDILISAKDMLASFDADLMMFNKFNVAAYIFRAKNFYQMSDQQEIVVEPKKPFGEVKSMEEIAASVPDLYLDGIPELLPGEMEDDL